MKHRMDTGVAKEILAGIKDGAWKDSNGIGDMLADLIEAREGLAVVREELRLATLWMHHGQKTERGKNASNGYKVRIEAAQAALKATE